MTSALTKYAAKKVLGQYMKDNRKKEVCGKDDPFFAEVTYKGRPRKVMRQIPDYFPKKDHNVLRKAKRRAYRQDMCFGSGTIVRGGWDSIIGIIPVIGDFLTALIAAFIMWRCGKVEGGLPSDIKWKMRRTIAWDVVFGFIPIVGDLADTYYKANTRNVRLLENYLIEKHMPPNCGRSREYAGMQLFKDDPDYDSCFGSVEYLMASEEDRRLLRPQLIALREAEKAEKATWLGIPNPFSSNKKGKVPELHDEVAARENRFDQGSPAAARAPTSASKTRPWSFFGGGRQETQHDVERGYASGPGARV